VTWEPVIGVETHVELATASKMFCGCRVRFGAPPNTDVCPVCLGLPGALPVTNERAIELLVAIGLALQSEVVPRSMFHRKNYFYADMPKNFQISQYDVPVCRGGHLDVEMDGESARVRIHRAHMEEDTGKSIHVGTGGRIHAAGSTLLDFNRAGVPLAEIVSEPDIRSPAMARAYAQQLRSLVLAVGASDARLEEGSIRFDANVSLREEGSDALGTKVEVKNMNSFRSLERALAFEIERQRGMLDSGEMVVQETRHWDEETGVTHGMRSKEESSDYRYFPEPDLVPVVVDEGWRARVAEMLPELPASRQLRYRELGVEPQVAAALAHSTDGLAELFDEATALGADPRMAANWLTGDVRAHLRREGKDVAATGLDAGALAELSALMVGGRLSGSAAKEVLAGVIAGEGRPEEVAVSRDLLQVSDRTEVEVRVAEVLAALPDEVARARGGEEKLVGFLVGQVMKATRGKADPSLVAELVRAHIAS
jgi:aspartyl-tRNA(Asn)/glutamyl-tRNA(Gln) amidotransferase subunit B